MIESFEERCIREFEVGSIRAAIWDKMDKDIAKAELEYKESLYIPLLCELIAMGTYLKHKNVCGYIIFTEKKLPKPIQKLTFEHKGKDYSITDLIDIKLEEYGLKQPFYQVVRGLSKLNIQKTRENKYFKLDEIM